MKIRKHNYAPGAARAGRRLRGRGGYLLIEAIVALGILAIGLAGILTLFSNAIGYSRSVSDSYAANYLAAEGIEVVKDMVDANAIQKCSQWWSGLSAGSYEVSYYSGEGESPSSCGNSARFGLKPMSPSELPRPLYLVTSGRLQGTYDYFPSLCAGNNPSPSCSAYSPTRFTRTVSVTPQFDGNAASPYRLDVSSTVAWTTIGGAQMSTTLSDRFYDWEKVYIR